MNTNQKLNELITDGERRQWQTDPDNTITVAQAIENEFVEIGTFTGSEWHSSYGASGMVFVIEDGQETPIYQSKVAVLVEDEWTEIEPRGHGKWCKAIYRVPNGTLLRLYAMATHKGVPDGGGSAYFIADKNMPRIGADGQGYLDRIGTLYGRLRRIPFAEFANYGLNVRPSWRKYYRDDKIDVTLMEDE